MISIQTTWAIVQGLAKSSCGMPPPLDSGRPCSAATCAMAGSATKLRTIAYRMVLFMLVSLACRTAGSSLLPAGLAAMLR
ncbi:hypothetical protein ACFQY5_09325 [Paeniroseomonas aquatica]|uniref:hypothetical protein n=1 Tax=Paeniroseomonas aquatica TaxID=373043 RepID=UPI003624647E